MKCLKNKVTAEQFTSQMGIVLRKPEGGAKGEGRAEQAEPRQERSERRDDRQGGRDGGRSERPAREERGERQPREDREPREGGERREGGDDRRGRGGRGRGGRGRRDGEESGEESAAEAPSESAPVAVREGDPRTQFKQILGTLAGSLKAVLLDDTGKTVQGELAVRELADTLKGSKDGVHAVVFDGVITQRLLDIAAEKKIATVVGVKMGNVTKVPDTVEILTRDDLQ
jgi:hypothetical protein